MNGQTTRSFIGRKFAEACRGLRSRQSEFSREMLVRRIVGIRWSPFNIQILSSSSFSERILHDREVGKLYKEERSLLRISRALEVRRRGTSKSLFGGEPLLKTTDDLTSFFIWQSFHIINNLDRKLFRNIRALETLRSRRSSDELSGLRFHCANRMPISGNGLAID